MEHSPRKQEEMKSPLLFNGGDMAPNTEGHSQEYLQSIGRIADALGNDERIDEVANSNPQETKITVDEGNAIITQHQQPEWDNYDVLGQDISKGQRRARRMSQRFTSLAWKDIYQSIGSGKLKKHIVKDIAGYAVSGQVVGIIGPSGCGKTTLLNILANRTRKFSGSLFFNGRPLTRNDREFKQQIGYVIQDDCFLENLTVREQLMYSARLRLPKDFDETDIKMKVDDLLAQLGLTECADTLIGSTLVRGISGGERKRTNIAVELISNPNILFLDEPTSGLDSYTARQTVALCRKLAIDGGRIVVMSIHQPRSDIFDMLDTVMLMSAGETVYYGPGRQYCKEYFADLGYSTPPSMNPADFLLDLVAAENDKRLAGGGKSFSTNVARMVMAYKQRKSDFLPGALLTKTVELEKLELVKVKKRKNEWAYKSRILLKRSFKNYYRDPRFLIQRISQAIITGLIIGVVFFQITTSQTSVQDRMGLIFLIIMNLTFPVASGVIEVFTKERAVFFREKASKMYGTLPYYISKVFSELPLKILELVIQGTIIYWMVGFSHLPVRYITFLGIIILQVLIAGTVGLAFSGICDSASSANMYVSLTLFISITFSGFLRNEANTPLFLVWAKYLSFIRYTYHALAINEFTGLVFTCSESQKIIGPGGQLMCPIPNGEAVLETSDFEPQLFLIDLIVLGGFVIVSNILAFFMLHFSARRAQGK